MGNKYVVVTGASSGIGYSIALEFAKKAKNLIITARSIEKLEQLKSEIHQINDKLDVVLISIDLSNCSNAYKLFDQLEKYDIEVFINNAGFGDFSTVSEQNLKKTEQMISLNITSLVILSTLYVNKYQNIENSQLINVSSTGGYSIVNGAVTYCATKFFVSSFTEGLNQELQLNAKPLKAKILAPNATATEFAKVANDVMDFEYNGKFHTSQQMAEFTIQLYESDKCIGKVTLDTFEFELLDPIFNFRNKGATSGK